MTTVNERIKIVADELFNGKIAELERACGLKKDTLKHVVGGRLTKPSFDTIASITSSIPDIRPSWLIIGEGTMSTNNVISVLDERVKGSIPYYADLPVSAGEIGLATIKAPEDPTGYMLIPGVSAERLFPVIGCSMEPKIKAGDIIGVNMVNNWDRVDPDKIYMIVTKEERMIKRLRTDSDDDGVLWCVSDNHGAFKIDKSDIIKIFHVVCHVEAM